MADLPIEEVPHYYDQLAPMRAGVTSNDEPRQRKPAKKIRRPKSPQPNVSFTEPSVTTVVLSSKKSGLRSRSPSSARDEPSDNLMSSALVRVARSVDKSGEEPAGSVYSAQVSDDNSNAGMPEPAGERNALSKGELVAQKTSKAISSGSVSSQKTLSQWTHVNTTPTSITTVRTSKSSHHSYTSEGDSKDRSLRHSHGSKDKSKRELSHRSYHDKDDSLIKPHPSQNSSHRRNSTHKEVVREDGLDQVFVEGENESSQRHRSSHRQKRSKEGRSSHSEVEDRFGGDHSSARKEPGYSPRSKHRSSHGDVGETFDDHPRDKHRSSHGRSSHRFEHDSKNERRSSHSDLEDESRYRDSSSHGRSYHRSSHHDEFMALVPTKHGKSSHRSEDSSRKHGSQLAERNHRPEHRSSHHHRSSHRSSDHSREDRPGHGHSSSHGHSRHGFGHKDNSMDLMPTKHGKDSNDKVLSNTKKSLKNAEGNNVVEIHHHHHHTAPAPAPAPTPVMAPVVAPVIAPVDFWFYRPYRPWSFLDDECRCWNCGISIATMHIGRWYTRRGQPLCSFCY